MLTSRSSASFPTAEAGNSMAAARCLTDVPRQHQTELPGQEHPRRAATGICITPSMITPGSHIPRSSRMEGLLKVSLSPGFMPPDRRHPSSWPRIRPVSASQAFAACACGDTFPRSTPRSRGAAPTGPKPTGKSNDLTEPSPRSGHTPSHTTVIKPEPRPTTPGSTTTIITDRTPASVDRADSLRQRSRPRWELHLAALDLCGQSARHTGQQDPRALLPQRKAGTLVQLVTPRVFWSH